MDWDKLRIFHTVAKMGSLTHAGDILQMSQPAVSRQIRALEIEMNVPLFHRHARGMVLTEQGELLYEATTLMARDLSHAASRIKDSWDDVFGELRVTTTTGFGTLWLAPRLGKLYQNYPNLTINLILKERVLDLMTREADVAIRMKEPSQADLIRKRLMDVNIRLYASANYVQTYGTPKTLKDLAQHRLIAQHPTAVQVKAGAMWLAPMLDQEDQRVLYVNNYFGIMQAILNDLGVGALPHYLAFDRPELIRIFPDQESAAIPVYLAYVQELKHSKRVAVLRDFVVEEIKKFHQQSRSG